MCIWLTILFQTYKTCTSVLLRRSGEFVAFGYEAEHIYNDAKSRKTHAESDVIDSDDDTDDVKEVEENVYDVEDLLLFKQFQMMLLNNKVNF